MRATAALYDTNCSGCHGGTDGRSGRAPSLFNQQWLNTAKDPAIEQAIRQGIPNTEMGGFTAEQLSDQQIFELIAFIRGQAGSIAPKPEFVADPDGKVIASEKQKFKIEVVTRGLETPWGMVFLPDGRMLITERAGRIRIYSHGKLSDPVKGMPVPHVRQDAGYLDITIHPHYAQNGWIYLSYSEALPGFVAPSVDPNPTPLPNQSGGRGFGSGRGPQVPSNTVIVRGRIDKQNEWVDQQLIFRSPARVYATTNIHYGSRFLWDKQGRLFFTLGERGAMQNAQDLTNPLGKVHRINDDGSVPKDNPFVNTPGADPTIWSYGHRNPQGLAWDPVGGILWESEHGPTGGDEINAIKAGHNYGWGVVSMGIQPGITERSHEGMDQPVVYYTPAIAPSAIAFYTGDRYPRWKNTSLFVCALIGEQLRRLEVKGEEVTHQEVVFAQFGRVRDIVQGPDGYFYLALQNPTGVNGLPLSADTPGMVIRLIPVQ
ncbi:MAG: PQQ-dependent sugar dehydrogenase [Bryobacteraceae bacterium]|jgi:glucose/arabinose dehydrogenase